MSIIKHTLWASHVRHSFIPASNVPLGVQISRPLGRKEQARSCPVACCGVFDFTRYILSIRALVRKGNVR